MFSCHYHSHDFYRTCLYMWVTRRMSYKKQELAYPPIFCVAHLFWLICYVCYLLIYVLFCFLFVFVLCHACSMLSVSLDCPFVITRFSQIFILTIALVSSNVSYMLSSDPVNTNSKMDHHWYYNFQVKEKQMCNLYYAMG